MVRLSILLVAAAALVVLCLSACGVAVVEDGPHTQQTRAVGEFDRVEVHGSTDVVVRRGRGGVLTVSGGRNRVRELVTRVEDGALVIERPDSSATIDLDGGEVTVVVRTPSLAAARVDGSGDLALLELGGRRLDLEVDGSGDVRAGGRISRLEARVSGSGDLDLGDLLARTASVELAGSGDADVAAERRLDVSVEGSGDVRYAGHPLLREDVEGSGSVERQEP